MAAARRAAAAAGVLAVLASCSGAAAGPPKWVNDTMALVERFKLVDAALAVWAAYLGAGLFFLLVAGTVTGIVWVSTNSVIAAGFTAALVGLFFSYVSSTGAVSLLPPEWQYLGWLLTLVGLAAALYRLIRD